VYKSKEGAVGLHPNAGGNRADAMDVDVHFMWDGAMRTFRCGAGGGRSWQFLTVRVFHVVGIVNHHCVEAFGTVTAGPNLLRVHLGPFQVSQLPNFVAC
jgi:hypothetical protein